MKQRQVVTEKQANKARQRAAHSFICRIKNEIELPEEAEGPLRKAFDSGWNDSLNFFVDKLEKFQKANR